MHVPECEHRHASGFPLKITSVSLQSSISDAACWVLTCSLRAIRILPAGPETKARGTFSSTLQDRWNNYEGQGLVPGEGASLPPSQRGPRTESCNPSSEAAELGWAQHSPVKSQF